MTNQGDVSDSQLAELCRTILAKVLWNLLTNKSETVTAVSEPQYFHSGFCQQPSANRS